jgi:50S ribosomal protein L16 3-hydroxylase
LDIDAPTPLLGGISPAAFMRRHWQKKPLLVRGAVPGMRPLLTRAQLFALAGREGVESRLVSQQRGRWQLERGPFGRRALPAATQPNWTLLVQGVDLHDDRAHALLQRFAFVPQARLDDLMISWASDGGGVGPHFDSYDVFLLQASGQRRWRYGRQDDLSLRPRAPLKVLARFAPQHDAILAPGDMLYLPPDYAHDGIASDACMTYSIGFRAPLHQELAEAFLDQLRDTVDVPGRYADPDLRATATPARVDSRMRRKISRALAQIRLDRDTIDRFVGRYLSEPKPGVVFAPPGRASRRRWQGEMLRDGVRLDRRTQLLYDEARYYLNGEESALPPSCRAAVTALADRRMLSSGECASLSPHMLDLLFDWHRDGFLARSA